MSIYELIKDDNVGYFIGGFQYLSHEPVELSRKYETDSKRHRMASMLYPSYHYPDWLSQMLVHNQNVIHFMRQVN